MNLILFFAVASAPLSSLLALVLHRLPRGQRMAVFTAVGISGITAIGAGFATLVTGQNISYNLASTLPNLTWQLRLDPLSGFFLAIVGLVVVSVAFYGPGYVRSYDEKSKTAMYFFTGLFISSMYLVLIAYDALTFMLAWELMSITSYFLVIHHHEQTANRHAALIYLLMAQTSGLFILFAFSILIKSTSSMSFLMWHEAIFSSGAAHLAFFLALLGFGMKAGVVPLHVWLPKAHPVAPSHISALMSGVMLKVAVYGLVRFTLGFLRDIHWQWGAVTLFIGIISALLGVLYALMQHDLKKLLAYHSIENIGIIFSALGIALIFASTDHPMLAALGLIASFYHCLNHALFKSLLFLGAGAITMGSHEHDLERMGGLIKKMPHTAWCFLIGCISISALPPFNGFVSEWLFFQTALQAPILKSEIMRVFIPIAAAAIALTSALAAACFVKVYGVAFLGQPRSSSIAIAKDPQWGMRFAMGFLALLCLLFGILPNFTISLLNVVTEQLISTQLLPSQNWLWLVPVVGSSSSYSPLSVGVGTIIIGLLSYGLIYLGCIRTKTRSTLPWDCGYGSINQRMQYSATAFAMPIRRIFHHFFLPEENIEKINGKINYALKTVDLVSQYTYAPLERLSLLLAKSFAHLQGGKVRVYLTYMFITLIFLLWIIA